MKLHITSCRVEESSARALAVTEFVLNHTNSEEIANYLASNFTDDFFEVPFVLHSKQVSFVSLRNTNFPNNTLTDGGLEELDKRSGKIRYCSS